MSTTFAQAAKTSSTANASAEHSSVGQIWPIILLSYCFLFPPEVAVYLGSFRMEAYRIALFALLPWVLLRLANGRIRLGPFDIAMVLTTFWLPVSFTQNYDLQTGIEAGGSQTIDMLLAYLSGRCCIRTLAEFRRFLLLIFPGLAIAGGLVLGESLSGSLFVRSAAQSVFGGATETGATLNYEYRAGLLRAFGPFPHPIHAGMYLSAYLPMYFMLFRKKSNRSLGFFPSALGFFSLSSAGLLGFALNIILLCYDWLQNQIKELGWKLFLSLNGLAMILIQLGSEGGLISFIYRYFTFNPATGWYRSQIWRYSIDDVLENPWFGLGYEDYSRPYWFYSNSIDAHFLAMAVKYGLVPALIYMGVALSLVLALASRAQRSSTTRHRNSFVGLAIGLATITVLLFTVTLWGAMLAWLNMLIGLLVSIVSNRPNYRTKLTH